MIILHSSQLNGLRVLSRWSQSSLPPASADSLVALDQQLADLQQPLDEGKRRVRALQTGTFSPARRRGTVLATDSERLSGRARCVTPRSEDG
jgi:hypothetical protein